MKSNQERFLEIISRTPKWVQECFNGQGRLIKHTPIKKGFGALSPSEKVMVAFVMMIWTGNNDFFPKQHILCNIGGLDYENHRVIAEWVCNPFWM